MHTINILYTVANPKYIPHSNIYSYYTLNWRGSITKGMQILKAISYAFDKQNSLHCEMQKCLFFEFSMYSKLRKFGVGKIINF